jgi:uncharacterized membrane protein YphA (DoxX/SURF4 family)
MRHILEYISPFCRLFLGGILLAGGLSKLPNPWFKALDPVMVETFSTFSFLPLDWIHGYASLLPWVEGTIALALLFGFYTRVTSAAAIVMLAGFLLANLLFLSFGIPCACMGENFLLVLQYAIAFNLVLMAAATWLLVRGDGGKIWAVLGKKR